MRVHIRQNRLNPDTSMWEVWVTLDETDTRDLDRTDEAFVIASGRTRDEALHVGRDVFLAAAEGCVHLQHLRPWMTRDSFLTDELKPDTP